MTMSEFVVTQWNCKTKTHGLLSASVFFTYFCFVSQNKIMTLTLNKKTKTKKKTKATQNENDYLQLGSRRHQWRKETKKPVSIMSPDRFVHIYLLFFFFSLSLSLYKVYLPLALHCSCWTFRGMFKKTKKETVENRI